VRALGRAIEAGIEIVLATGRRFDFARAIFDQLPGPLTLILSNGAVIKTREGETLLRHLLPRDVARAILGALPEHRGRAALLFDRPLEGQIVYERVEWDHPRHRAFFRANRRFISEIAPLEDALTEDPLQVMFTGECATMRDLFAWLHGESGLKACPAEADSGQIRYSAALTEYLPRDFSLVDIIHAGCSKGAALREWTGRRGIDSRHVMAIGDNLNDLQMLEFAGYPVVMGNAVDELKDRGWRQTARNDDAGVAAVIEEILQA
jgi:hypothetical protein